LRFLRCSWNIFRWKKIEKKVLRFKNLNFDFFGDSKKKKPVKTIHLPRLTICRLLYLNDNTNLVNDMSYIYFFFLKKKTKQKQKAWGWLFVFRLVHYVWLAFLKRFFRINFHFLLLINCFVLRTKLLQIKYTNYIFTKLFDYAITFK
jgi:hypothetical protein